MVKKGEISQKADTWRKAKAFGFGIITVDGWFRNPAVALVEFGSLFTIIYDGFYTSQVVIAGFLSSTLLWRAILVTFPLFGGFLGETLLYAFFWSESTRDRLLR